MGEIHDPDYVEKDGRIVCRVCGYPAPVGWVAPTKSEGVPND